MKPNNLSKMLFYELVLLFASVFVFRSLWMIYDQLSWLNHPVGVIGSLIVGVLATLLALAKLNQIIGDKSGK